MPNELLAGLESKYQLPSGLLNAVMQQESGGNTNAVSPKGAQGSFQFMPATAKQYGVDVHDMNSSADGAARMYSDLLKAHGGDLDKALASYNYGQGNVAKYGMDNLPKETQDYIAKIKANMPTNEIDASQVKWDEPVSNKIDAKNVVWDKPTNTSPAQSNVQPANNSTLKPVANMASNALESFKNLPQTAENAVAGLARGASRLPSNVGEGISSALEKLIGKNGVSDTLDKNYMDLNSFDKENKNNTANNVYDAVGQLAATAGAGNVLGGAVKALPIIGNSPKLAGVVNALESSGMKTGINPANLTEKAADYSTRFIGGAATGAAQVGSTGGDTKEGAKIAGILPVAVRGGATVANAALPQVDSAVLALANKAKAMGIPISAAQLTDNRLVKALQSATEMIPFSGAKAYNDKQGSAFKNSLSQLIGQSGDNIGDSMAAAKVEHSAQFDKIYSNNMLKVTPEVNTVFKNIADNADNNLVGDNLKLFNKQADLVNGAIDNGNISGTKIMQLRKSLWDASDNGRIQPIMDLRRQLTSNFTDQLQGADKEAYQTVNQQFKNRKNIESSVPKDENGNMQYGRLAQSVASKDKNAFIYDQGNTDLADLSKIGSTFLRPLPSSGTAERSLAQKALLTAGIGGAGYEAQQHPDGVLGSAALTLLLARAGNKSINSETLQKIMSNTGTSFKNLQQLLSKSDLARLATKSAPIALTAQ